MLMTSLKIVIKNHLLSHIWMLWFDVSPLARTFEYSLMDQYKVVS